MQKVCGSKIKHHKAGADAGTPSQEERLFQFMRFFSKFQNAATRLAMDTPTKSDRLTVMAIAIIAYASGNIAHEILGHCGTVALLGSKCTWISTTYIPGGIEYPSWRFRVVSIAGSATNWLLALICLGLLRRWRNPSPAWRYLLWLTCCVNLFIPSQGHSVFC